MEIMNNLNNLLFITIVISITKQVVINHMIEEPKYPVGGYVGNKSINIVIIFFRAKHTITKIDTYPIVLFFTGFILK